MKLNYAKIIISRFGLLFVFLCYGIQSSGQSFSNLNVTAFEDLTNAQAYWVDFDNDGLLDLFVAGTNGSSAFKNTIYFNNGDDTFSTLSLASLNDIAVDFGDYNNDEYIDIVITGVDNANDKKFIVYRNNNGTAFVAESFSFTDLSRGGLIWADLDMDMDLDLVATGLDESGDEQTLLYSYDGTTYSGISHNMTSLSNGQIKSFDLNNDQLPEILITGLDDTGIPRSLIYSFDNELNGSSLGSITGTALNSIGLGDWNEDGYIDIAITGAFGSGLEDDSHYFYNNNVNGFIQESDLMVEVSSSSVDFADMDNDGLLDLIVTGIDDGSTKYFNYHRNSIPSYFFDTTAISVENIYDGDAALGDFDNDGDLDLFQVGNSDISFQANLYESDQDASVVNNAPSSPSGLTSTVIEDSVYLSWTAGSDDLTSVNSLSYAVYVSENSSASDLTFSPLSDVSTGYRKINRPGNAGFNEFKSFHNLPEGRYYWSVQTIDNGNKGSAFASEESFAVCYSFDVGNDTSICYNEDILISAGEPGDDVDWESTTDGYLFTGNDFNYTVLKKDTLIAIVDKPYGCVQRDSIIIDVYDLPDFTLGNDTSICFQEILTLSATGFDSVNWYSQNNGASAIALNQDSYDHSVTEKDTLIAEVFNINGCVNYDSIIIDVIDLPSFNLGNDTAVCFNEDISISVASLGIVDLDSVNWYTTINGSTSVLLNNETYTHPVTEKDTVVAEVFNTSGCVNYDSIIIDVIDLPSFSLGNDTSVCFAEEIILSVSDLGIIDLDSVNWYTTNNGSTSVLLDNETYTHLVSEKDTVVAEVFNSSGCVNYDSIIVDVVDLPSFNLGSDTAICFNEELTLSVTDLGIVNLDSVNWYTTNSGSSSVLLDSEDYTFAVAEKDTIIVEVFNTTGCVNYDSIIVDVIDLPSFSLGNDTSVCFQENITLSVSDLGIIDLDSVNWYTTINGSSSVELNAEDYTHIVTEKDTIVAEVFNSSGCVNYDSIIIDVIDLPSFSLGEDTSICFNEEITFNVDDIGIINLDSANWYSRNNGSSAILTNEFSYTQTITEKDTIIVEVFNTSGCVNYDTIIVDVIDLPSFSLGNDTLICFGESITLSVSELGIIDLDSVNWYLTSNGSEAVLEGSETYTHYVTQEDVIVAEVFNSSGCVGYDSIQVNTIPLPDFSLGDDLSVCYLDSTSLSVSDLSITNLDSVNWYIGNGDSLVLADDENYTHQVLQKDTIIAEVFNYSGCVNWDTIIVDLIELPSFSLGNDTAVCNLESISFDVSDLGIQNLDSTNWYTTNYGDSPISNNSFTYTQEVFEDDVVIAEVFNSSGCVNWDSIAVDVLPLPDFDIGNDTSICFNENILLETSLGFQEVNWYSKNSGDLLESDSWFFNYQVTTTDTIIAEVYSFDNCVNYDTIAIVMIPLPVFSLGPDQFICDEDSIELIINESFEEINWYTGSNQILEQNSQQYKFQVTEDITLWAEAFNERGCVYYDTITIKKLELPQFELGEDRVYCDGDSVIFEIGNVGAISTWQNANSDTIHTEASFQYIAGSSDELFLTIETDSSCIFRDSIHITVNELPSFAIEGADELCENDSTTLSVEFDNWSSIDWYDTINNLSNNEEQFTIQLFNSKEIFLRLTDENSCINYDSIEVIVHPRPTPFAGNDTLICFGEDLQIGSPEVSGYSYEWTPPFFLNDQTIAQPTTSKPDSTITYILEMTSPEGCNAFDSVFVEVNPAIIVNAGGSTSICIGDSITIGGNPTASGSQFGYTYSWSPLLDISNQSSSNPTVFPKATTTYVVEVSSNRCSIEQDTITVTVNPLPEIEVSPLQNIGAGGDVELFASGGIEYYWSPEETIDNPLSDRPNVSPLKETTYQVEVMDENGCISIGEVTVRVSNQLFVPTLFTPNGDGSNDTFKVFGTGVAQIKLSIYDKNGNKVYSTNTVEEAMEIGWDGTNSGQTLRSDTYIWTIEGNYFNGSRLEFEGRTNGIIKLVK